MNLTTEDKESQDESEAETGSEDKSVDLDPGHPNSINNWHQRLGNLSTNGLKQIKRLRILPISKIQLRNPLNYVRCIQGKENTVKYKKRPRKC